MDLCSIHYIEQTWDSYPNSLNIRVILGDLVDGRERPEPPNVIGAGLECRDISALISPADRRKLLDAIRRVQLGYVAEPLMGCDGSDHDLTITFSPTCSIHCHWWAELSEEWQGVAEIVKILRRYAKPAPLSAGSSQTPGPV